ncbi:hypothetical protein GF360_02620 [candidate division WWE3 bacterium]|nr:hypothetical protein [candidate division WWE3 bacterium]
MRYNIPTMKLLITGGHHSSALPLIDYIQENRSEIDLFWLGHKHSMRGNKNPTLEYKQITSKDIPFYNLNAGKFYKTYDPKRLIKIPWGFLEAFYYLLKIRPHVVLSFGGYLAVPVVFAAWVLGIPTVTHEQTLVTGYANKFISFFADKILISHEESRNHFPKKKTEYSGLPLRKELFQTKTKSFQFNNDLPVLYITAGKTGSHIINETIKKSLEKLLQKFNVIHQCGDHSELNDYKELSSIYERLKNQVPGKYYLRKFVLDDEIGEVFANADLFLSRSGAHITVELETFQIPSVLIPIPWVSHNEQQKNAEMLANKNLAKILPEKELVPAKLIETLDQAIKDSPTKKETPQYDNSPVEKILSCVLEQYEEKKSRPF